MWPYRALLVWFPLTVYRDLGPEDLTCHPSKTMRNAANDFAVRFPTWCRDERPNTLGPQVIHYTMDTPQQLAQVRYLTSSCRLDSKFRILAGGRERRVEAALP